MDNQKRCALCGHVMDSRYTQHNHYSHCPTLQEDDEPSLLEEVADVVSTAVVVETVADLFSGDNSSSSSDDNSFGGFGDGDTGGGGAGGDW